MLYASNAASTANIAAEAQAYQIETKVQHQSFKLMNKCLSELINRSAPSSNAFVQVMHMLRGAIERVHEVFYMSQLLSHLNWEILTAHFIVINYPIFDLYGN